MGVNAQTSVPTFTAGEVLTAANMNISARTGIPVFADSTARDAAFGGTGEKTLAEGQFAYLESTNTTQYYDGAAWQSVGASALTLINSTTFTTATSVSLPANTFSATYNNYLLLFDTTAISTTMTVTARFRASGADDSSAEYHNMLNIVNNDGGGNSSVSNSSQTAFNFQFATTSRPLQGLINVQSPFLSKISLIFPQMSCQSSGGASRQIMQGAGQFGLTTSFDSFSIIASTGTFTGTLRAYGYANS